MKTKKLGKKLHLNKTTIAVLDRVQQLQIKAGEFSVDSCYSEYADWPCTTRLVDTCTYLSNFKTCPGICITIEPSCP